jgi:hypothetical protein
MREGAWTESGSQGGQNATLVVGDLSLTSGRRVAPQRISVGVAADYTRTSSPETQKITSSAMFVA